MKEEPRGFKYRLSDVLAWLGFSLLLFCSFIAWTENESLKGFLDGLAFGLPFHIFFGILNYLLVGRMRLIPWIKN
jgi:hypothetical protein